MSALLRFVLLFVLLSGLGVRQGSDTAAQERGASTSTKSADTYFVPCGDENKTSHVTGPVSVYGKWRAYVEVTVQAGCCIRRGCG